MALADTQLATLRELAAGLSPPELSWASGYLAGVAAERGGVADPAPAAAPMQVIEIFYGSQTGNGRRLAKALAERLEGRQAPVRCRSLGDIRARDLAGVTQALFVVSTHGDGDPPDDTVAFFDQLAAANMPRLANLAFGVLALGDRSYEKFCETGRQLHERLESQGARALLARVDCDVDYQAPADDWMAQVLERVEIRQPSNVIRLPSAAAAARVHDRNDPALAEVLDRLPITGRGSGSLTHHIELAIPATLGYVAGDALAVAHVNPPQVVEQVLAAVGLDGTAMVELDGETLTLDTALARHRELTRLSAAVLDRHLALADAAVWEADDARRREILARWQYAELARACPIELEPQALVDLLPAPRTRLYSLASDPLSHAGEAHLTVAAVHHQGEILERYGAASAWLNALQPGAQIGVWIEPNPGFRLPEDPATPVLMIAAGTGIAPFRAFVQQRAQLAAGPGWLLFGHRHRRTDFLYQAEWLRARDEGALARLDVAFSRDGHGPRYVQDALLAAGRDVFDWLEQGAHVYVCGSVAMGRGVDDALTTVVEEHGAADGRDYLQQLKADRRYQRDVY